MDGQALELGDESFDMAGSQFGVMLFSDMPKGISEKARVVKPGGIVLVIAYGDPHRIEFLSFFVAAIQSVRQSFEGPSMTPPPLPFQLQDPERLRQELAAAGLKEIKVETITETTEFLTGNDLWEWVTWSNPIAQVLLGELNLSDPEKGVVRQTLGRFVSDRAGDARSALLSNPINIGIGTRPPTL